MSIIVIVIIIVRWWFIIEDIDHSWRVFTKDGIHDNDDHLLDARDYG